MGLPPCSIAAIAPTRPVQANDTQDPQRSWSVTGPITPLVRQSTTAGRPVPAAGPPATPAASTGCAALPPNTAASRVVFRRAAFALAFCSMAGGVGCHPLARSSLGAGLRATHLPPAAAISACNLVISSTAIAYPPVDNAKSLLVDFGAKSTNFVSCESAYCYRECICFADECSIFSAGQSATGHPPRQPDDQPTGYRGKVRIQTWMTADRMKPRFPLSFENTVEMLRTTASALVVLYHLRKYAFEMLVLC